ncbi:hypothetical protein ABBQ38_000269 [Trebouxia sp. C0009 RCD-2024]
MSPCADFITEIWRRIRLEFIVELPLLRDRWKLILFGACFQYVHGISTQLAHRMHQPANQPLHDIGFSLLPELGQKNEWVSELIFGSLFASFMLWSFSPFVTAQKRFYTAVLFSRLLLVLVICQTLRILSFTSTQLPSPNYHCRLPELTAIKDMPLHWWGHFIVDLGRQTTHGCGDLIFSSHTTFALVGMLTYTEYGAIWIIKAFAWCAVFVLSVLIVASRKHYTVDVLIAWYVVPLVFYAMLRRWTTKRPVNEEPWPHRSLAEDDALQLEEIVVHGSMAAPEPPSSQQLRAGEPRLPSIATGKSHHLPNGKHPQGHAQSLPGTPTEPNQQDSSSGAAGSSRKSPTTMMRPRSTQVLLPETLRDQDFQWDRDETWEAPKPPSGGNNSTQLGPTAPRCVIV